MAKPKPPELSHCVFSEETPTPLFRYKLEHRWDDDTPSYARKTVVWVMLNPSTADSQQLDPTLRRCKGFSKRLGAGGMVILNLFAFRATLPKDMLAAVDPVGPLNDDTIARTVEREDVTHVIAGWGVHGAHRDRDKQVTAMLTGRLSALKVTKDGRPGHPLYIKGDAPLLPFGSSLTAVFNPPTLTEPCSSPSPSS